MDAFDHEPEIECEECHKTFPAREIKYNGYFKRYLCTGCRRKLAGLNAAAGLWLGLKVYLIGWAILIVLVLVFSLAAK